MTTALNILKFPFTAKVRNLSFTVNFGSISLPWRVLAMLFIATSFAAVAVYLFLTLELSSISLKLRKAEALTNEKRALMSAQELYFLPLANSDSTFTEPFLVKTQTTHYIVRESSSVARVPAGDARR